MEYFDRLQSAAAAAQGLGRLTDLAVPLLAGWLGYRALRLGLRAARAAFAFLRPGPSELCRELLAALDGEAVYDPADRKVGTLRTDGCLVMFTAAPSFETAAGFLCQQHLSRRDYRRVVRKAYARRDAVVRRGAALELRRRLGEVRRGRLGPSDGAHAARPSHSAGPVARYLTDGAAGAAE